MTDLRRLKETWEHFARRDALWAICTDNRSARSWDSAEFFASGRREIETVLALVRSLGLPLAGSGPALDFGCGVGRLTQALADCFEVAHGVDISSTMIALAQRFNRHPARCHYTLNESNRLPFADDTFAFIYSSIVLQHIEPRYVRRYLEEFVRVLKPDGVLVFQMPDRRVDDASSARGSALARLRARLRLRTRLKGVLAAVGVAQPPAERRMEMHVLSEDAVRRTLGARHAVVVDVKLTNSTREDFSESLRYLPSPPARGLVSKQYCVTKTAA